MVSEQTVRKESVQKTDINQLKGLLKEDFVTRAIAPKSREAVAGVLVDVVDTASAAIQHQDSAAEEAVRAALKNPKIVQEMRVGLGASTAMAFSAKIKLPDETVYLAVTTKDKNTTIALFNDKFKFVDGVSVEKNPKTGKSEVTYLQG